jgi:tripeptide aminopeptidase
MKELGIEPKVQPIRGGTDGSRLSFMGLPCPNIFGGGHNFHGRYEYIPAFAMGKAVEVILKIIEIYSK